MDAYAEVVKQFYEREGAHNDKFRLNAVVVPDGTLKGRTLLEIAPIMPDVFKPKQRLHLLNLPFELRLRIYGYSLMIGEESIRLDTYRVRPSGDPKASRVKSVIISSHYSTGHEGLTWDKQKGKWVGAQSSPLSLLLVNKQINEEATPSIYRSNCFKIRTPAIATAFAENISAKLKHLTMIHLHPESFGNFKQMVRALDGANGLRTVYLSDAFILNGLRDAAKRSLKVSVWARVLSHALKSLLLDAQATYRAQDRKWLALDIVQVKYERQY